MKIPKSCRKFMRPINFIHIAKNAGTSIKLLIKNHPELKIIYHGHNANINKLNNQMIIVRHPYDRFCSAVKYAIKNYPNSPKIKKILNAGLVTPTLWAETWGDPKSPGHSLILDEVINGSHMIGDKLLDYKWTYEPQTSWFNRNKVSWIIPFDKIEKKLLETFGVKISQENESYSNPNCDERKILSEDAKEFLKEFYAEDFKLWNLANQT